MKIKQLIQQLIKEQLLKEAFMSPKLAKFAAELRNLSKGNYGGPNKLLKGVAWDKIPDSEVQFFQSGDPGLKPYVNSDAFVILWYGTKREMIKYKPTTYSRQSGRSQENSVYLRPGQIMVTSGREFLYGYNNLTTFSPARNNWDKPYGADLSVLKLSKDLKANALVLGKSTISKYSTVDLMTQRSQAKDGATALMQASQILSRNQERYRKAIRDAANNKRTAPITKKVEEAIAILKTKIEEYSRINFNDLVTYKTHSSEPDAMKYPTIKKIDFTRLQETANLYQSLVIEYESYIRDIKKGYNPEYSERRLNDYLDQVRNS